jgi:hypothetical protein
MIEKDLYLKIKRKYGYQASWAVWNDAGQKPMLNMGIDIFDLNKNPSLLETLNNKFIMVGLNISKQLLKKPFINFHTDDPAASAGPVFKVRHAFKGTRFYGAYMTDIIKDFIEKSSGNVILKNKNGDIEEHVICFQQELKDLKSNNPLLIAFGNDSFKILNNHFKNKYEIIKIPHYSNYISKEKYREKVLSILPHNI